MIRRTKSVDWILGTGQNRTHMIYVSPDMKLIVTTNVSSGTVSVIEKTVGGRPGPGGPPGAPRADWNETVIRVGNGSEGFDVSPDGKEIWVANAGEGTVSIIDMASKQVTQTLAPDVSSATRLKFTPDGKLALISALRGADVTVIDAATRKTIKRIAVGPRRGRHCHATGRRARVCSVFARWLMLPSSICIRWKWLPRIEAGQESRWAGLGDTAVAIAIHRMIGRFFTCAAMHRGRSFAMKLEFSCSSVLKIRHLLGSTAALRPWHDNCNHPIDGFGGVCMSAMTDTEFLQLLKKDVDYFRQPLKRF